MRVAHLFDVKWVQMIDKQKEIKILLVEKNDKIPKKLLDIVRWDKFAIDFDIY